MVGNTTIQNNSPQFEAYTAPIHMVCWKQQRELSFAALDADGDELEYALDTPMSGCNSPVSYLGLGTGNLIPIGSPANPCSAQIPGTLTSYSPSFPVPSFDLSGSACPAVRTASPSFRFNAQFGSFQFTPVLYNQQSPALNRYTVACNVLEYRRINGIRTLIGSVRQEMMVVVVDFCTNRPPDLPVAVAGNANSGVEIVNNADSTFVYVSSCNYTRVLIRFSDDNSGDLLTVTNPFSDPVMQTSTPYAWYSSIPFDVAAFRIVGNGTSQPVGILDVYADVAFIGRVFNIPLQIVDNACPVRGRRNRTIRFIIRPRNAARIEPVGTSVATVCAGSSLQLKAMSGRPDTIGLWDPRLARPAAYSYRWAPANGLSPADQSNQTITVAPTQTTRYHLQVTALDFRMLPLPTCVDTASLLIRVLPKPPQPVISQVGTSLVSSAATGNQWYLNGQPIAGATAVRYRPNQAGTYTVVATMYNAQPSCSSLPSDPIEFLLRSAVQIVPNPINDGRLVVQLTGYQQPVVLTVFDALGRPVVTATVPAPNPAGFTQVLNMVHTTAGVYLLHIAASGGVEVQRVVVRE
ncbi:T9SS type A sorting domain-containing protein [Hymenobacter psychrotolerans]|nr:T9SS type A sorting domain-containing protein [Hymenobacter psychrotolerans]